MTIEEIAEKAKILIQIRSIIIGLGRLEKLLEDDYPPETMRVVVFKNTLEDLAKKIGWEGRGRE